VTAIAAVVIGTMIVLVTAALGHCSAFGGTCANSSSFDGEVFGSAATGTMLAVGGVLWMQRPSWRGLLRAVVIAAAVAIPVAVLVMGSTQG
jgi:hypothetical protein